jgi:hypothetical protein
MRCLKAFAVPKYVMALDPEMAELASDLFRTFARFEYCLKITGYCFGGRGDAANPDWTRFASELPPLSGETSEDVVAAISYILGRPPKNQVYFEEVLQWRDVEPQAENENDLIFLYVRRIGNNLFHGGKFNGRFFDPERSMEFLEHSITILITAIFISAPMLEAYESRTD